MKTDWIAGLLGPWSAELTLGSIFLRLAISMVLAAIIGCERSSKRHSAGLRTFILVSLAGTATMLIDQYLMDVLPITIPLLSASRAAPDSPASFRASIICGFCRCPKKFAFVGCHQSRM